VAFSSTKYYGYDYKYKIFTLKANVKQSLHWPGKTLRFPGG
jgi:hypothetical protein